MADNRLIAYSGKWRTVERRVSDLPLNLQYALETHEQHLADGAPVLLDLGFQPNGVTCIQRGQPVTCYEHETKDVAVYLTGLSHWQVFIGGAMQKGTREVEGLRAVVERALTRSRS